MTGLRRGEILGLRWEHIDLAKRTISIQETRVRAGNRTIVETPKTRRSRRVFSIDQRTARALERWKAIQSQERLLIGEHWRDTDGYVVTEPDGRLPNPNTFTRQFEAVCTRLGFPKIRLHDLRHTYVSAARHSGVDLKTISERVGHADINVTLAVYDHVFHEDDAEAATTTAEFIYRQKEQRK
jgi:integrase